jgi:hypothetical protein
VDEALANLTVLVFLYIVSREARGRGNQRKTGEGKVKEERGILLALFSSSF